MRDNILPIRPLWTASGFIAMKVLSIMSCILRVLASYTKRPKGGSPSKTKDRIGRRMMKNKPKRLLEDRFKLISPLFSCKEYASFSFQFLNSIPGSKL